MRRVLLLIVVGLLFLPASARAAQQPQLTEDQVVAAFLADGQVASWVKRYPADSLAHQVFFDQGSDMWRVYVGNETAGVVADGRVSDETGEVTQSWAGPQVYWTMARGYKGIFGGQWITKWPVWVGFCFAFLAGVVDFRRLLSWRNADLLVLLSFSVSLVLLQPRSTSSRAIPLVYPPLLYLLGPLRVDRLDGGRGAPPGGEAAHAGVAARRGNDLASAGPADRARRRHVECDRRRLLGRDRRSAHLRGRVAVRSLPAFE